MLIMGGDHAVIVSGAVGPQSWSGQALRKFRIVCLHNDSRLALLTFDLAAAGHAGPIRAELTTTGAPIGPCDVMVAGHARARGFRLVTNNEGEFSRGRGLLLENWSK